MWFIVHLSIFIRASDDVAGLRSICVHTSRVPDYWTVMNVYTILWLCRRISLEVEKPFFPSSRRLSMVWWLKQGTGISEARRMQLSYLDG
jgi:hypothetical protein